MGWWKIPASMFQYSYSVIRIEWKFPYIIIYINSIPIIYIYIYYSHYIIYIYYCIPINYIYTPCFSEILRPFTLSPTRQGHEIPGRDQRHGGWHLLGGTGHPRGDPGEDTKLSPVVVMLLSDVSYIYIYRCVINIYHNMYTYMLW